tara:strand:+ start:325 stop:678 length:354 start_codon:yes stop_codon:yes gene_type:complete
MRKLSYLPIIGLLFFASCGSNPAEVEVSSLETLCDHVEALGEIYDEMEELMGMTRMEFGAGPIEAPQWMIDNEEFIYALATKEEEIKYSMLNNTFKYSEVLFKECANGEEYYPWLDK